MKEIPGNIKDIIIDHLQNKADEASCKQLNEWRLLSVENDNAFKLFEEVWQQTTTALQEPTFNIAAAWDIVDKRIAAPITYASPNASLAKAGSRVTHLRKSVIAASVLALILLISSLLFRINNGKLTQIEALTQNQEVVLPDSSHVILRKGATLQYPIKFDGRERKIFLKGEAFFMVQRNVRLPFRIQTEQSFIEVKGTSFLVHASGNADQVVVASGSVLFSSKTDTSLHCLLNPQQKAVFNGKQFATIVVQDSNYLSWYTRELKFAGKELSVVAAELADFYKVDVILSDTTMGHLRITGTFHEQPLTQVLDEISILTGLQYKKVNTTYLIY
ncbi:MAG: FecR domain-containing protein [Filimonas sp.]|nr:FecR domain-containing protein [Filimonas sp.]